ncbi:MAG: ankyrin repeat domain-containing protein [Cocleimonas sp.]
MKVINAVISASVCLFLSLSQSTSARTLDTSVATGIKNYLVGEWCLNKEEFQGDISMSGDMWTFTEDGKYKYGFHSLDGYSVTDDNIKLNNMGTFKVLNINQDIMVAKIYSTYYFSKNSCSKETKEAIKITQVNNAIIQNNIEKVKAFIEEGVNISKADLRSSIQSTPLMVAIRYNNIEIIELLLKQNPDLSVTDYLGRTALDTAKKSDSKIIQDRIKDAY